MSRADKNEPLALAVVLGVTMTLFVTVLPVADIAYDSSGLHLALETAEGVIAAHLAYLVHGRYRLSLRVQHLLLAWSWALLAFVSLALSAAPIIAVGSRPTGGVVWTAAGLRLAGMAGFCAAAFAGPRLTSPGSQLRRRLAVGTVALAAAVAIAATGADAWLANALDPTISPDDGGRLRLIGNPVVLVVQLLGVGLYTAAAIGFRREARRDNDELLQWVGAGAVLAAFARLNYFLFPSLHSNWVYTGDLLRLAAYLFFVVGAAREINAYWRGQADAAVVEERRRLARELHDGLAQELAFIRSQTSAMASGRDLPGMVGHVAEAADRALTESRQVIEVLAEATDRPLPEALRAAGEQVAARAGAEVAVEAEGVAVVDQPVADALVRVVREAVTNAVRHGDARQIRLRLCGGDDALHLSVTDDGRGFDPEAARRGFGLRSMRERLHYLGGDLQVTSVEGEGTLLEIRVPPAVR